MSGTELTPAQCRVLRLLAAYPGWFSLLDLDCIPLLEADTEASVPPLADRGLVDLLYALQAVRITRAGAAAAARVAR